MHTKAKLDGSAAEIGRKRFVSLALLTALIMACSGGAATETTRPADTEATTAPAEPAQTTTSSTQGDTTEDSVAAVDSLSLMLSSSAFSATYYPVYIAMEQGYLEEENLTVELMTGPGSGNAVQQLIAGNVDAAIATPAAVLAGVAQGYELAYVQMHWYDAQFNILVPENGDITDFTQLKDRAIGIPELSGSEVVVTEAAILDQGWTPGIDLRLTVVGEGATMLRALEQGAVDAVASNLPNELQLEAALGARLTRITPDSVKFHGDGIVVRQESLSDPAFRDAVVGLVRAVIKGRLWAEAHADDAYAIVKANYAKEQLGDPGDDSYGRPYFGELLTLTAPKGGVEYGYFEPGATQNVADFLTELGYLESEVDVNTVIDETIVRDAWTEIDAASVAGQAAQFEIP